jgi:hypothetical protein
MFETSNLDKVKNLIIKCTKSRPSGTALTHLSKLSSDAIVQYIHAGIWKYDNNCWAPRTLFKRGESIITSSGTTLGG